MIDLLIAGAGPAGLATALYAERAGLTVTVVDPRALAGEHARPIDKACGEGLMPGAVRDLADLGVDPPGHPLQGIGYLSEQRDMPEWMRISGASRSALASSKF